MCRYVATKLASRHVTQIRRLGEFARRIFPDAAGIILSRT
jgi:hypothetical protein